MSNTLHPVRLGLAAAGGHDIVGQPLREDESPLMVTGADSLFHALDDTMNPARVGELSDSLAPRELELA